jgi:hypothetical protein
MQALLAITTLNIDRERRVMAVRQLERLHCAKRCVFVDQQIVIAETFAGKHFCQSRLSCINLSSLCQVRNVGQKINSSNAIAFSPKIAFNSNEQIAILKTINSYKK